MRIRKGHRCLPMPPADRSSLHGVLNDATDGANQALLSLVALASASVADNLIGGSQYVEEHAKTMSTEKKKCLEHELERNRVSAYDVFSHSSSFCNAGVDSIVREPTETAPGAKSVFTRREPLDKSATTSRGDSEFHHEKRVSSKDILGAAKQPQCLQKSRSNSLGSAVIEPREPPSVHCGKRKEVQNKRYVRQSKVARADKHATTTSHTSSSSASRSPNATQVDPSGTLCARDDGKGWMCPRPAQVGFAMCTYHRDLINQGKERRMRARLEAGPNLPFRYVANARVVKNAIMTENSWSPFSDDELSYDEHRRFVKAKSITSLLLNVRHRQ